MNDLEAEIKRLEDCTTNHRADFPNQMDADAEVWRQFTSLLEADSKQMPALDFADLKSQLRLAGTVAGGSWFSVSSLLSLPVWSVALLMLTLITAAAWIGSNFGNHRQPAMAESFVSATDISALADRKSSTRKREKATPNRPVLSAEEDLDSAWDDDFNEHLEVAKSALHEQYLADHRPWENSAWLLGKVIELNQSWNVGTP